MMDKLIHDVQFLVGQEYDRSSSEFGIIHHSNHEAYAVLMEEIEEAADEHTLVDADLPRLWNLIKRNASSDDMCKALKSIQTHATLAACEFIQVAAMAKKAIITCCAVGVVDEFKRQEDSK